MCIGCDMLKANAAAGGGRERGGSGGGDGTSLVKTRTRRAGKRHSYRAPLFKIDMRKKSTAIIA
jgi:hypothetical protein